MAKNKNKEINTNDCLSPNKGYGELKWKSLKKGHKKIVSLRFQNTPFSSWFLRGLVNIKATQKVNFLHP